MQRATLIAAAGIAVSAAMPASVSAQSPDIFCQPIECGTFRKITNADLTKFQDPFFRLVLSVQPTVRKLDDIEKLILGNQGATRRFFVVDELVASSKQPGGRRSVVDFLGSTNGIQLAANVFLSFSFSSNAVPVAPDLEVLAWDDVNGTYNFYKLDSQGPSGGQQVWKVAATSRNVDTLSAQQRAGTCLACHANGIPVMKELLFPWNNWHSFKSTASYLTNTGPANLRWPVRTNPHFQVLTGAETFERTVLNAIDRVVQRRFTRQIAKQPDGKMTVANGKLTLRALFETTEINLRSADQFSGLHPLTGTPQNGPFETIRIPASFFLQAPVFEAAGIGEANEFPTVATIKPADYKTLIANSGVKLAPGGSATVAGDTNFAWFTPEQGAIDTAWITKLVNEGVVSKAFAAAVAAADLETPIFSAERAKLLQFVPATFTVTPNEAQPDALTKAVIDAIDAAAPAAGSVAAQFRDMLKAPDPVAAARDKVKAYKDRIAAALGGPSPAAEQQRLFGLLLDRRRAFEAHPMFGPLVESGALIPLP